MGGEGNGIVSKSPFKKDAPGGECIYLRGFEMGGIVAAQSVRPQGIDGDKKQIEIFASGSRGKYQRTCQNQKK